MTKTFKQLSPLCGKRGHRRTIMVLQMATVPKGQVIERDPGGTIRARLVKASK
jgi:hypothetical protein